MIVNYLTAYPAVYGQFPQAIPQPLAAVAPAQREGKKIFFFNLFNLSNFVEQIQNNEITMQLFSCIYSMIQYKNVNCCNFNVVKYIKLINKETIHSF